MKIEIGESLIYSWLRHIKKCQIVQLNWKASEKWDKDKDIDTKLRPLMDKIQDMFDKPFGNIHSLQQLVKSSEIDVVGFDFQNKNLYCVDIAFHSYGLRYSDNVKNVTKKILRTLLILDIYFNNDYNKKVIFSTPKITPKEYSNLIHRLNEIKKFVDEYHLNTSIEIISNEKFQNEILNPILSISDDIADTSELFLRSYQLTRLFGKKVTSSKNDKNDSLESDTQIKIGKFVQSTFERLFAENKLSNEEITRLMDLDYSRQTFKMSSYPVLTTIDLITDKDRKRYYKKLYGEKYLLCSQWYKRQYPYFNNWLVIINQKQK